jgi:hypothetical protein
MCAKGACVFDSRMMVLSAIMGFRLARNGKRRTDENQGNTC